MNETWHCDKCDRDYKFDHKESHLRTKLHLGTNKIWHCNKCDRDYTVTFKSLHLKTNKHLELQIKKPMSGDEVRERNRGYVRKYLDKHHLMGWRCEKCEKDYHIMSKAK